MAAIFPGEWVNEIPVKLNQQRWSTWIIRTMKLITTKLCVHYMGLLPDIYDCGLHMRRECWERFHRHCELAIPTCITARAWRAVMYVGIVN